MKRLIGFVVLLLLFTPALYADVVLVGSVLPVSPNAFWPVTDARWEAQQFSLSGNWFVTTIDLNLYSTSQSDMFTLSLVSALTGPATTYASFTFAGNGLGNFYDQSVTLNQSLNAGAYYLLLTGNSPTMFAGWTDSDGSLIQNDGTVANGMWQTLDGGATWTFFDNSNQFCSGDCFAGVFTVNGTAETPVPEPASLLLLGSGLLLGARRFQRRGAGKN